MDYLHAADSVSKLVSLDLTESMVLNATETGLEIETELGTLFEYPGPLLSVVQRGGDELFASNGDILNIADGSVSRPCDMEVAHPSSGLIWDRIAAPSIDGLSVYYVSIGTILDQTSRGILHVERCDRATGNLELTASLRPFGVTQDLLVAAFDLGDGRIAIVTKTVAIVTDIEVSEP